jgi:hypothetical protein
LKRDTSIIFRQSLSDFPCIVQLGEKTPSWGLSRWGGGSGLRFVSPDDEGFTLRGDRQRLVYKGRRRSHRFTILGDTAFEYDCILEREPESNVISLRMEGAEQFDFYRQPYFVKEPFLKGSYAVYKKETLIGEGTGKLCHIHRPEVIDARGRRCWGDLSIVGNELRITIPEWWLSEAKYPVVVDPTIGTSTVGSQTHWNNVANESVDRLTLDQSLAVNRFSVPEILNGTATAYVYAYHNDYEGRCKPVLYSDNNNVPQTRRSSNEGTFDIAIGSGKPAGWRSTSFKTSTSIASGSYIWYGMFSDWFSLRFDYGAKCYWDFWDVVGTEIPNTYPVWKTSVYFDFKLSMYFTYTSGQNYQRTLTQGVTLSDNQKTIGKYKRITAETVQADATASKLFVFICKILEEVNIKDVMSRLKIFIRGAKDFVGIGSGARTGHIEFVTISDTAQVIGSAFRGLFLSVRIVTGAFLRDHVLGRFLKAKTELVIKSCVTRELIIESRIGGNNENF